ncbi:MAG: YkvA family protein [Pseudolabrys sp.]
MAFARATFREHDTAALSRRFWRKLAGGFTRVPFAEDLLTAYYCAFDRATPLPVKASLIGALAYFVLPADSLPDILPVLGFSDDAAVLAAAIKLVTSHIRPEHRDAAKDKLEELAGQR